MGAVHQLAVRWATIECCECGAYFQVTDTFYHEKARNSAGFYCPSGHYLHYGESGEKKLRRQLEAERESTRFQQRRLKQEQDSHRATKGHLTRQKKRVAAGLCPCCNRTFKQLARHMKSKHPSYSEPNDD